MDTLREIFERFPNNLNLLIPCALVRVSALRTGRATKWVGRRVLRQPKQMLSLYQRGVSRENLASRKIIGALGQGALPNG